MSTVRQVVKKIIIGAVALAVLFVVFLRTLQDTASTPYVVKPELLAGWQVVIEPAPGPDASLISLVPPRELTMSLFQQVFERTMESMNAPSAYGMTLILRREFDRALAGRFDLEELVDLARASGLEQAVLRPTCFAVRSGSATRGPGRTFYVAFDLPALRAFREEIRDELGRRGGDAASFDPDAVAPLLYLAATDGGFWETPPVSPPPAEECTAPVELTAS